MDSTMVGQTVYSADGGELGTVKEIKGRFFKVDAPMQPDYWLSTNAVQQSGGRLVVSRDAAHYDDPDDMMDDRTTARTFDTTDRHDDQRERGVMTEMRSHDDHERMATGVAPAARLSADDDEEALRLREERLRVEKDVEDAGAVRLGKRVVDRTETVEVPVREERLVVERVPGSGEVVADGTELREGESIEVPLKREEARVEKETVDAGEVRLRKETVERREQVSENLRREELDVDDPDNLTSRQRDIRGRTP